VRMPELPVVVVVVMYNSEKLLSDLVASLGPGIEPLKWELVFVDNASSDGSLAEARRLAPDATIVDTGRNGGYAAGINAGVAKARPHSAVLVLNPDVRLSRGCVPTLMKILSESGAGIAVPRLLDARGELIPSMRREPTLRRAAADTLIGATRAGRIGTLGEVVTSLSAYTEPGPTDWAEGSTQLISRECWNAVGTWDEGFFLYSEETDYDLRARDAGLGTWFVPDAVATHLEGGSASNPGLWPLLVSNKVRLYRKRHGRVLAAVFWAVIVVREMTRSILGIKASRAAVRRLTSPRKMREVPGPHSLV